MTAGSDNESEGWPLIRPIHAAADREKILNSIVLRGDIDSERVLHHIDEAAFTYDLMRIAQSHPEISPSEQVRFWESIIKKVQIAHEAMRAVGADVRRFSDLAASASDIAQKDGGLPDFEPVRTALPLLDGQMEADFVTAWPAADDQLRKVDEELSWLLRVLARAKERAAWDKTVKRRWNATDTATTLAHRPGGKAAGRRPDEALHRFVLSLDRLYWRAAQNPDVPRTQDRGAVRERKDAEVLRFLRACILPLIAPSRMSNEALSSLWQRATSNGGLSRCGDRIVVGRTRLQSVRGRQS